jgi:hypothetical protein
MNTDSKIQRSLFVEGREWFDKVNGNSYFSARIWVDGGQVAREVREARVVHAHRLHARRDAAVAAEHQAQLQVAAVGTLLIPVVGVFSSALLVGERIGLTEIAALGLITASLAVVLGPRVPGAPRR